VGFPARVLNFSGQKVQWSCGNFKKVTSYKKKEKSVISGAYLEHLGVTFCANALSGGLAVLHRNLFGILHFALGFTLDTVCFHKAPYRRGIKEVFHC
jgi:hypothetical protein